MKSVWALVASLALMGASSPALAQYGRAPAVDARAVIHQDNTRSDVIRDPLKHEMTEIVYDSRGVVISKKKFLLNENGDPTQGQILDGADNLIARVQFLFDDLQRLSEERCVNLQGEVFRRVLHQYDANGRPLPVKAMDYKVKATNMRAGKVDYARSRDPRAVAAAAAPVQPGQAPQIETVSTSTGQTYAVDPNQPSLQQQYQMQQAQQAAAAAGNKETKEKKRSFLGGLFHHKD